MLAGAFFLDKYLLVDFVFGFSNSGLLYFQGVPVAPLWDFGKGHFVGVLSAIDFILILREVHGYFYRGYIKN